MLKVGQIKSTIGLISKASQGVAATVSKATTGKPLFQMPDYLYHFTSSNPLKEIISSGKLKVSSFEKGAIAGLPGVYMVDKGNFFTRWLGKKYSELREFFGDNDLGELLLSWIAMKGGGKMVAIKIPVSQLDKAKLRFRPYISTCKEAIESFGGELTQKGLPLSDLPKYITKEPIEYAYTSEIPTSLFAGIKSLEIQDSMTIPQIAKSLLA